MLADGALLGSPTLVAHNSSGNGAYSPSLVWNGAGWAVAWWEIDADFYEVTYLRLLNASGTPMSPAARLSDAADPTHGIYDEMPLLFNRTGGGYLLFTGSYMEDTGAFEIARLQAVWMETPTEAGPVDLQRWIQLYLPPDRYGWNTLSGCLQ